MAVRADEKYEAVVKSAMLVTATTGTGGLAMVYETAEGATDKTWFITANTVERLKKNLNECFGITEEQLQDEDFLNNIGEFLRGKTCSITTELRKDSNNNVYKDQNGKTYVTVQWMNPSRLGTKASGTSVKKMAGLFGGHASGSDNEPPPPQWGGEEQAPF